MSLTKLAKCLGDIVDDGHLARADAEEVMADAKRRSRRLAESMNQSEAERQAALDVVKARAALAKRGEYLTALSAKIMKEVEDGMRSHPKGLVDGALSFLTKDWTGKAGRANLEYRAGSLFSLFDRAALDLFERYAPKALGFKEQTMGLRATVRELFEEESGDGQARAAARAWREVSEKARAMFNQAGGDIGQLETWRLPQSHDMVRIRKDGEAAWTRFMDDHGVEVRDKDGEILTGLERMAALKAVYETVSTGGRNKGEPGSVMGSPKLANQRGEARVLHFTNAEGWLAYHDRFGTGSLYSAFGGHLKSMAGDIAALEVLGPNPKAMVRMMEDLAERGEPGSGRAIRRTWEALEGASEEALGWRRALFSAMQTSRNILRAAQMGSAVIPAAFGDIANTRVAAAFNGLETTKVLGRYLAQLNPLDASSRDLARRFGLVSEATIRAMANSRAADGDAALGITGKLANAVFAASGMNAHTHGMRAAFGLEVMATLAENAGHGLDQLDPALAGMLRRGGIDEARWNWLRAQRLDDHGGTKFMDALSLADGATDRFGREAALDLHALIKRETDYAVPEPDARARGMINLGTKANTLAGELWRSVAMYRSFPVTVTLIHSYRAANAEGGVPGKLGYGLGLMITSTATAALAIQAKQIVAGKDPRDMTKAAFWGGALLQADGMGILGDFFHAALSRTDKDLTATLAGTSYGLVSDIINLTTRNALAEAEGKPSNTMGDLVSFLGRYQPGSNLWYARAALQRLAWNQLQLMADPTAPRSFARMENKAQKDYGQRFWWRPGETLPTRSPNLSAAVGDHAP